MFLSEPDFHEQLNTFATDLLTEILSHLNDIHTSKSLTTSLLGDSPQLGRHLTSSNFQTERIVSLALETVQRILIYQDLSNRHPSAKVFTTLCTKLFSLIRKHLTPNVQEHQHSSPSLFTFLHTVDSKQWTLRVLAWVQKRAGLLPTGPSPPQSPASVLGDGVSSERIRTIMHPQRSLYCQIWEHACPLFEKTIDS